MSLEITPELATAGITLLQVVLVALIAQAGAAWIGRQQRKGTEAQQVATLTDNREARVMAEADGLRAELRAELAALRAAYDVARDELATCRQERDVLRDEATHRRGRRGRPP